MMVLLLLLLVVVKLLLRMRMVVRHKVVIVRVNLLWRRISASPTANQQFLAGYHPAHQIPSMSLLL